MTPGNPHDHGFEAEEWRKRREQVSKMADTTSMPFLDDPQAEIQALIDEQMGTAAQYAHLAEIHMEEKEWAESRTASLISQARSAIALNMIARNA